MILSAHNRAPWVTSATISEQGGRVTLIVVTQAGGIVAMQTHPSIQKAKKYYSRNYGAKGQKVRWVPQLTAEP